MESFRGRSILVTGGTGAFGQKFLNFVRNSSPSAVTLLSRDEMKHAAVKRSVGKQDEEWLKFRIGDICSPDDLETAMQEADIVIHAAAMKHLPECELNPLASTRINVQGTQNVVRAFLKSAAENLIFLSTDKAPYASSIYGAQKYLGEKLIAECDRLACSKKKAFSLRYSNVIDSTGAAFHIFGQMLRAGKKVSVNGTQTVRGFVTQGEVLSCIDASLQFAKGGETVVIKPRVIRIAELATAMRDIIGKGEVEITESTGFLGEKDSATLIMAEELSIAKEFPEAELQAFMLDTAQKHKTRKAAHFGHDGGLTLEHCPVITGAALKEFLHPVMKANEML